LIRQCISLLVLGFCYAGLLQAQPSSFRNFSPNPISRPHQQSISVDAKWDEFIRFLPNRGPTGVHYLTEVLKLMEPARLSKLKGFQSPKKTRLTLSSLEFRSAEVMKAVEHLLSKGYLIRLVVDSGFAHLIEMPTEELWDSWSEHQRAYFVRSFDHNRDGKVEESDLKVENRHRALGAKTWMRFQKLAEEYSGQLELIESPREIVPVRDEYNYPRLHHTKALSIQFKTAKGWSGPIIDFKSSANFTDTCLDRRVQGSEANLDKYLDDQEAERLPQSQGHIQFGAVFGERHQDPKALEAMTAHLEKWYQAYTEGQAFDFVNPPEFRHPALTFKDGSTLEVFYSEGQRLDGKKTIDPIWAITETLNRKDLQLTAYFDTQFVFTHSTFAKHLRSVLSRNKPKELFLAVDGSQATEPWSALPHALFAPIIRESAGVLPGKAIEDTPEIDESLRWEENVYVYEGGADLHGRENDKLHLKLRYFEFINAEGVKVHVVMWGSANTSHNTSKLSSDVTYIFKTKDPKIAKLMRPFFETIRKDRRMVPYSRAYLSRTLLQEFHPTKDLQSKAFYERFAHFLSGGKRRDTFDYLISTLKKAGPSTVRGKLLLQWLQWSARHRDPLKDFGWDDFWILLRMTESGRAISGEFFEDVRNRWTSEIKTKSARESARRAFDRVRKLTTEPMTMMTDEGTATSVDMAKARLRDNCQSFLELVRQGGEHRRVRHPVVRR
jgi:hypothetical protein